MPSFKKYDVTFIELVESKPCTYLGQNQRKEVFQDKSFTIREITL